MTDETLMRRYRDGDAASFDILYDRHKDSLYRFFVRQCSATAVAKELFQDVWLKLVRSRDQYEPAAKFSTYLYRLAKNRLIDHYRKQGRRRAIAELTNADIAAVPGDEAVEPDTRVMGEQLGERIAAGIDALPEAQRCVFLMYQESDMTIDDIASVMQVKRETIKSRLRYAMAKLRRYCQVDADDN
ncbi:MAG: sigma-70 family RNA polymerase sigma factor [Pseudomonadota bacterium]